MLGKTKNKTKQKRFELGKSSVNCPTWTIWCIMVSVRFSQVVNAQKKVIMLSLSAAPLPVPCLPFDSSAAKEKTMFNTHNWAFSLWSTIGLCQIDSRPNQRTLSAIGTLISSFSSRQLDTWRFSPSQPRRSWNKTYSNHKQHSDSLFNTHSTEGVWSNTAKMKLNEPERQKRR